MMLFLALEENDKIKYVGAISCGCPRVQSLQWATARDCPYGLFWFYFAQFFLKNLSQLPYMMFSMSVWA